jgi:ferredoxin
MEETNVQTQQLVINPGCIGCGHCVMAAPNNFAMNGRQAQVISQENIDSTAVQQAMISCKTQVIEIIEA